MAQVRFKPKRGRLGVRIHTCWMVLAVIALFAAPGALAAEFATHVLSFGDGALYGVTSLDEEKEIVNRWLKVMRV